MAQNLTLASGVYDLTVPLIDGLVKIDGYDLNVLSEFQTVDDIFRRMLSNAEFDACELSLSSYTVSRDQGDDRFIAIPVFCNRHFVFKNIMTRSDSGIKSPQDLEGRSLCGTEYQNTRWVWARGIIDELYGVKPSQIKWVTEKPERVPINLPPEIKTEKLPPGMTTLQALENGTVDAAFSFFKPKDGNIVCLFDNSKQEDIGYYLKTGMFPAMHTVVIKRELVDRDPSLPTKLMAAYQRAKELSLARRQTFIRQGGSSLIWLNEATREQSRLIGEDPFAYGLKANEKWLNKFLGYLVSEGLISNKPELSSMFASSLLET
ncbi:MAG: hypothetical protein QQN63_07785 [Nitrosopumilus sp.]